MAAIVFYRNRERLAQRQRQDKNTNNVRKKTKSLQKCHITEMILEPLGEHVTQNTLDDGQTVMFHECGSKCCFVLRKNGPLRILKMSIVYSSKPLE